MDIFQNLRQPKLANQFENKLVTNFIQLIYGFDINKLVQVSSLPGPKGTFGDCSKHCKAKVTQFGGEVIYGIIIDLDDSNVYATFHCIWKYNNKLFDVTQPEMGHEHNKNSIFFIPANESQNFIIRKVDGEDFYFFPKPVVHMYKKNSILFSFPKSVLDICFQIV